ncbi:MAG: T9SS type A sorting domain-containing protein [bacterium]
MNKLIFVLILLIFRTSFLLGSQDFTTYPWAVYSDEYKMKPVDNFDYEKAEEAGFKWISIAALWTEIQKSETGACDWTYLDDRVNKAIANNLNIHFYVAGFPEWIAEKRDVIYKKEYPPKDDKFGAWQNWVRDLAARYKDKVSNFEIYPEGEGACSQWAGSDYTKIFPKVIKIIKYASQGIKEEFSNPIIMAIGDAGPFEYPKNPDVPYKEHPFFYHLENGYDSIPGLGKDLLNGVSLHLYPNINSIANNDKTLAPEEANEIKLGGRNLTRAIFDYYAEAVKYNTTERRIYLTEQGYSVARDVICRADNSWVNEDTQADYIVRFHVLALSTGLVDRIHYFVLRDDYPLGEEYQQDNPSHTGLLTYEGGIRASYYAYKTMATTLGNKLASEFLLLGENKYAVVFVDRKATENLSNNSRIIVAWKTTPGSEKIKALVNSTTSISYQSRDGSPLGTLSPVNGYVEVTLNNDSPIYIFDHSQSQEYKTTNPPSIISPSSNTSFASENLIPISGKAKVNTIITLFKAGKKIATTLSDGNGDFTFSQVILSPGGNGFQVAEESGSVSDSSNFIYLNRSLSNNNEVTFKNEYGKINIPASTLPSGFFIDIYQALADNKALEANQYFEYPIINGSILNFTIKDSSYNKIASFSKPLTVIIPYLDTDNNGIIDGTNIKETNLKVIKLDEENKRWNLFVSSPSIETNLNLISFSTTNLSIFALAEIESSEIATILSPIKVCPNPFNLNQVNFVTFKPTPNNTSFIKIFNLSGELIYTLKSKDISLGMAHWDGTNEYGKIVSSGVYIFYLKTEDGKSQKKKIVIIK